jgi:hypothetical protein
MIWTAKAILARHAGNRKAAVNYCLDIASNHPHLKAEYQKVARLIAAEGLPVAHA